MTEKLELTEISEEEIKSLVHSPVNFKDAISQFKKVAQAQLAHDQKTILFWVRRSGDYDR